MTTLSDPALEESIYRYYRAIAGRSLTDWLATLSADVTMHEPRSLPAEAKSARSVEGSDGAVPGAALRTSRIFQRSRRSGVWRCNAVTVTATRRGGRHHDLRVDTA
jgi:hypothetical protein